MVNIYNQLVRQYDTEKEKMNNDQLVDKLNLMFIGYKRTTVIETVEREEIYIVLCELLELIL